MNTTNLKDLHRERDNLKLSAHELHELNECEDPLHNILRNVLTSDFFKKNPQQ